MKPQGCFLGWTLAHGKPATFSFLSWMFSRSAPCSQVGVHTVCVTSSGVLTVSLSERHDLPRAQFLGLSFQKSVKEKRKKGMPFTFSF